LKRCQGRPFGLQGELKSKSQTEIPVNWPQAKAAAGPKVMLAVLFMVALSLAGCFGFAPRKIDESAFAHNVVSAEKENVRVSIAVLNEQEEDQYFGRPLANKGIQAVWVRIENRNPFALWLMPRSIDPDYFSALETSYLDHIPFAARSNKAMDRFFRDDGIARLVSPHKTDTGFIFTNLSEGAKYVNVELWHAKGVINIGFFLQLPNGRFDYETADFDGLYARNQRKAVSLNQLRQVLANFQCCASSRGMTSSSSQWSSAPEVLPKSSLLRVKWPLNPILISSLLAAPMDSSPLAKKH
jgi:hypothetical protein